MIICALLQLKIIISKPFLPKSLVPPRLTEFRNHQFKFLLVTHVIQFSNIPKVKSETFTDRFSLCLLFRLDLSRRNFFGLIMVDAVETVLTVIVEIS